MKLLGIDYGRAKVGLAISVGSFAEPFKVIKHDNIKNVSAAIEQVLRDEQIDKVVVGISEGQMAGEISKFAQFLEFVIKPVPVILFDETLSTFDAKQVSLSANIGRKKRREMEDAYAASIMLQNYLDSNL